MNDETSNSEGRPDGLARKGSGAGSAQGGAAGALDAAGGSLRHRGAQRGDRRPAPAGTEENVRSWAHGWSCLARRRWLQREMNRTGLDALLAHAAHCGPCAERLRTLTADALPRRSSRADARWLPVRRLAADFAVELAKTRIARRSRQNAALLVVRSWPGCFGAAGGGRWRLVAAC